MCSIAKPSKSCSGLTLVEVLLAVAILAVITTVAAMALFAAAKSWSRGTAMTDGLHHGDYVMEQLVMGLRSAYYPEGAAKQAAQYGFTHEDHGDGPQGRDVISWVKIGGALVGGGQRYAETPHRVEFSIQEDGDGPAAVVRAWQVWGLDEDYDPESVDATVLSRHVLGFDCKASSEIDEDTHEIKWEDEWEETNRIPLFVKITLYVSGPSEDEPLELIRLVELPCGPLANK